MTESEELVKTTGSTSYYTDKDTKAEAGRDLAYVTHWVEVPLVPPQKWLLERSMENVFCASG